MLKENVNIAVETIKDPENLFWPSKRHIEVIGTKDIPNNIHERKIPNSLLINTENKIPNPNIKFAKKSPISFPILLPNQFQKKTEGIPVIPTTNHTKGSVFSKPGVNLDIVDIKVANATYPNPYNP